MASAGRSVIVYEAKETIGGGSRSALAAASLKKMGFKNVISLAGGYRDWQNSGS